MATKEPIRLLKANAARELGARVAFNFEDLRRKRDEYLAQVHEQARGIIEDARRQAEQQAQQTLAAAQAEGLERGLRDAEQSIERRAAELVEQRLSEQLQTALPAVAAAADALRNQREQWLARWETAAVRLSVSIAERLLKRELALRPDAVTEMLREALQLAAGEARVTVHLNPDDLSLLGDHADELVRGMTACAEAQVLPRENVSRGGCLIETRHGVIDARLETALQRLTSELVQE